MKHILFFAAALAFSVPTETSAHCQIPCGIYDDDNVISSMHTDYLTIEKAMDQIKKLSQDPSKNAHQLARWITNKESHAQAIQDKMLNYFLAQRLPLPLKDEEKAAYEKKLTLCHEIIVVAMRCKQSTESVNVERLHDLLHDFEGEFGTKKEG